MLMKNRNALRGGLTENHGTKKGYLSIGMARHISAPQEERVIVSTSEEAAEA